MYNSEEWLRAVMNGSSSGRWTVHRAVDEWFIERWWIVHEHSMNGSSSGRWIVHRAVDERFIEHLMNGSSSGNERLRAVMNGSSSGDERFIERLMNGYISGDERLRAVMNGSSSGRWTVHRALDERFITAVMNGSSSGRWTVTSGDERLRSRWSPLVTVH